MRTGKSKFIKKMRRSKGVTVIDIGQSYTKFVKSQKEAASTGRLNAKIRRGVIVQGGFQILGGMSIGVLIAHVIFIILWSANSLVDFLRWLVIAFLCAALFLVFFWLDKNMGEELKRWKGILATRQLENNGGDTGAAS